MLTRSLFLIATYKLGNDNMYRIRIPKPTLLFKLKWSSISIKHSQLKLYLNKKNKKLRRYVSHVLCMWQISCTCTVDALPYFERSGKKKMVLRNTTNLTIPLLLCDGEWLIALQNYCWFIAKFSLCHILVHTPNFYTSPILISLILETVETVFIFFPVITL